MSFASLKAVSTERRPSLIGCRKTNVRDGIRAEHVRPASTPQAHGVFAQAFKAVALCTDVAVAAGSSDARSYASGAAGALRHAADLLVGEGRLGVAGEGSAAFENKRVGSSELIGTAAGWDTALRCVLPDGGEVRAKALWPVVDPEAGVWMRVDAALPNLWTRGRLEVRDSCLVFHDDFERDAPPVPRPSVDLGFDLISTGQRELHLTPALAAALEISLVSGAWCHFATGRRWFADGPTARAIVRLMGCSLPVDPPTSARLAGIIDRQALAMIERLGWRHVPTPTV